MTIDALATMCAPIIWFSPDEPLMQGSRGKFDIPASLPFLKGKPGPVVYYHPTSARVKKGVQSEGRGQETNIDLEGLLSLSIAFYFYYPYDYGGGAHEHDIESAIVDLGVEKRGAEYVIYVDRVVAHAHGISGVSNVLDLSRLPNYASVSLPVTLLVEEGKHASCTDRNGDGVYMAGFDTNRRVNDAWGVRDVFGSGRLGTSYASWMSKKREKSTRLWPPRSTEAEPDSGVGDVPRYALQFISANEWKDADVDPSLRKLLKKNNVGSSHEEKLRILPNGIYFRRDLRPMWSIAYLHGTDEMPLVGGNLGLKLDFGYPFNDHVNFGLLYEPSLARWLDWYTVVGFDAEPNVVTRFAIEGGIVFRAVNPNWGVLDRLEIRIGARTLVYNAQFEQGRMVFEIGGARW